MKFDKYLDHAAIVIFYLVAIAGMFSCGGKNTSSNVESPGGDKTAKDRTLEAGADLLQNKSPLSKINVYLDGFHFYNGNINAQMEAHHYVSQINEDLYQAIMYDGNGPDAKIMGVEYIVTEKLFKTLPEEEKKLWHSHHHEVKSGTLIAPGIPLVAEHELMEKLVSTYGKIIHTWHTDQNRTLPVGSPMIMMGFTRDGQLKQELLADRDKRFNISTAEKKKNRADIPVPAIDPMANAWEKGDVRQLVITANADSALHKHQGVMQKEPQ
ncbi:OBAP family protein [Longitalea luteola]|uniref:OBAP family protein n=1 Tax=Longitalea luteola TaxID=2812563 RepID=UPI001A9763E8|nr:OBAP family protein [Longitalea luteola]